MGDNAYPSMTALLGLLAVAGFQNRDKIGELLGGALGRGSSAPAAPAGTAPASSGGGLSGMLAPFTGHDPGSFLGGGLQDLVDRFTQAGHGTAAQSWVGSGPNQPVAPTQLEQAIGSDTLANLSQQTGLSKDELLARLSRDLPEAVNQYTPNGRLPGRS